MIITSGIGTFLSGCASAASINDCIRVCKIVDFASRRAAAAVATSGFWCPWRERKPSSVFASAGISLPVVGEILVGTSTLKASKNSANLFAEDNTVNHS